MAARYSKVERRIWRDERFRKLPERGKLLWLYLLTNDSQDAFPGLFVFRLTTPAPISGGHLGSFRPSSRGSSASGWPASTCRRT